MGWWIKEMEEQKIISEKCNNCGKFFNKMLGVCPFCGTTLSETSQSNNNQFLKPQINVNTYTKTNENIINDNKYNNVVKKPTIKEGPIIMILILIITQLMAWFLPWVNINTKSEIVNMFTDDKIRYLNYLGSSANILNYYDIKVNNGLYNFAAFLMTVSIAIIIVYILMLFSQKYSDKVKGRSAAACIIVSAIFVELYRRNLNAAYAKVGLDGFYALSTTGLSIGIIFMAILAMVVGSLKKTKMLSSEEKNEYSASPQMQSRWKEEIESLGDADVIKRFYDDFEWSEEYRKLCFEEIKKRGLSILKSTVEEKRKSQKWFCPECARENEQTITICKCGYKKTSDNQFLQS